MKQSEKLEELLKLMQANPELPVIPCVDGDVVGGDDCYCWLGTWGASGIQEYIIGNERTYYREDDISEMNDLLYERYDPELVDETESFVNAASISDGSRYAVCQTAHNARNDEDSGTFAVIDVLHKKVLGKYHTEHGWKYMTRLYVDEREKCFWAYFGDDKEKVSFADRVKEELSPEQPKKENPAAEPSQKQNKKANIIAIAVAVFFAFILFGGFDLIAPRKRTTSTTRVSTPETNRSVLEETALNALDKESAAYISSIDAFYYSGKYTLTVRTVSSGGLYLPIVAEQTAQAVFDKATELGITLSEYKVEEFSEGNSSKVENLILWKSADGVTGTYTDDTGSSPYIETDVTIERLAEIVR